MGKWAGRFEYITLNGITTDSAKEASADVSLDKLILLVIIYIFFLESYNFAHSKMDCMPFDFPLI